MAVKEDYDNLAVAARRWGKDFPQGMSVAVLSPDQTQMVKLAENLSSSIFFVLREQEWDLNKPYPANLTKPRVIVACNVFHYSPAPELWFRNCFEACKEFWLQDLVHRPRGGEIRGGLVQMGKDGDHSRYRLGPNFLEYPATFDILQFQERLLDYWVYDAGSFRDKRTMINFMARFRGDLR